jgi:hypothetical protein
MERGWLMGTGIQLDRRITSYVPQHGRTTIVVYFKMANREDFKW